MQLAIVTMIVQSKLLSYKETPALLFIHFSIHHFHWTFVHFSFTFIEFNSIVHSIWQRITQCECCQRKISFQSRTHYFFYHLSSLLSRFSLLQWDFIWPVNNIKVQWVHQVDIKLYSLETLTLNPSFKYSELFNNFYSTWLYVWDELPSKWDLFIHSLWDGFFLFFSSPVRFSIHFHCVCVVDLKFYVKEK